MDKLQACELFVLDMDGTLYLGDTVLPGAHEFVRRLAETGRRYIYLTNNSSRSAENYVNRLRGLGFPCEREDVFTSGEASALYLRENHEGASVYVVGTQALRDELAVHDVRLTEDTPDVVLIGFDTELVYAKLQKAVSFLRHGAVFLAANPDWVCPIDGGEVLPDCGSICALLTAATGCKPVFIGKPERRMVDIISRKFRVPNEHICCVGDRLYTDIAVAVNAGAVSALVLSGETTREMLAASTLKPDYVFASVRDIP
jgi:Predicted sugar phosphatases of the HAD superfamily